MRQNVIGHFAEPPNINKLEEKYENIINYRSERVAENLQEF